MDQHLLTIIAAFVVIVAVVAVIVFVAIHKRRSQNLRARFGPEYDRVVKQAGDLHRGEDVLQFRTKRREKLPIVALTLSDRSSFMSRWVGIQSRFVDDPRGAVSLADQLVSEVMKARGYPVGDFEQRSADISVDHPVLVENYRTAHDIALHHSRGQASTEDLRKAMVHYHLLFDQLLGNPLPERKEAQG